jgi:hypothetical protein
MPHLKLSKSQYAELIRDIEDTLKTHMSGSGLYDFGAPETMDLHPAMDMPFWVHDSQMEGSGVIDKAKDAALKKGRELGGEAISAAAKRVESEAGKRGYDISGLTQKGVERAHSALHDAEGHAEKLLNRAQTKIESKAGLSGDGLYQTGNGMIMSGNGMFQAGRGSTFVTRAHRFLTDHQQIAGSKP